MLKIVRQICRKIDFSLPISLPQIVKMLLLTRAHDFQPILTSFTAMDRGIYTKQAEKLCIIRSHMKNLDLYKSTLKSLILTIAQKFLPKLNLIMTISGIQAYISIKILASSSADTSVFPTSKHLCS